MTAGTPGVTVALTLIVDLPITIDVSLSDHLIHFLIRQLLPQVGHHVPQLRCADVPIPVLGLGTQ